MKYLLLIWLVITVLASESIWSKPTALTRKPGVHPKMVAAVVKTGSAPEDPGMLVDHFVQPQRNPLGGCRGSFQKSPSSANCRRTAVQAGPDGSPGFTLRIEGHRHEAGWCGAWIHLFDPRIADPAWLDASHFDYLSIWIRGETGGEEVAIKLADQFWYQLEDSWTVARSRQLLGGGLSQEWQELKIPLAMLRRLNPEKLATLVFEFEKPGRQTVYIGKVSFQRDQQQPIQNRPGLQPEKDPLSLPKSLWVWQAEQLIHQGTARRQLFDFCDRNDVRSLWLQMLYKVKKVDGKHRAIISFPEKFRRLNAEAHARGIQVHALDGYPEYALREMHHIPLSLVDSVVEFNRNSNPESRFDGVHFDNEPHLLVGWHSPTQRKQILQEFLELNHRCQQIISAAGQMQYGIDIPFWWEEEDRLTGQPCGEVTFQGQRKPASFHCIDMLDNVGVMNYRDRAEGPDGMIAHGQPILEYAEQQGKCEIHMGVETFAYPPLEVEFLVGLPRKQFERQLAGSAGNLGRLSRINNYRIRVLDDGHSVHLGLEHPEDPRKMNRLTFQQALLFLAERLDLPAVSTIEKKNGVIGDTGLKTVLSKSGEYRNPREKRYRFGAKIYPGIRVTAEMASKITFAGEPIRNFQRQAKIAADSFGQYQVFSGLAVHCYETYQALEGDPKRRKDSVRSADP